MSRAERVLQGDTAIQTNSRTPEQCQTTESRTGELLSIVIQAKNEAASIGDVATAARK